jgi:nitrite reductase/ring-hydroxylating ferredoxin subunit
LVFVDVLSIEEIKPGIMKQVKPKGQRVLVVNLEGRLFAIGEVCTHKGCALSNGNLEGEIVRCPCHSSMFSVKTGDVVRGPAKKPEPVFETKLEGGRVFVNI